TGPVWVRLLPEHGGDVPVGVIVTLLPVPPTRLLRVPPQGAEPRAQQDSALRVLIRTIHADSRQRYGRPRIHRALRDEHRIHCSPKRVARLMRLDGLRGKRARRFRLTTQADGTPPAPNRLR